MEDGREGMFPFGKLVELLGKRDVQDVLVEGGPSIAWAVVESGLVDRLVLYFAPKLIGGESAPGILGGAGIPNISEAISLTVTEVTWMGDDLKVVADVHRDR
jgi:diaminohydroxyphosphoribosylaminopyrimidine deaminase/5-amino-6-(5-phosphoribosylamino)uracil reductase